MADRTGTDGDDRLEGTADADTINGLGGDDELIGLEGDDTLNGGDGDDGLRGGPGVDTLDGGPGKDGANYEGSAAAVTIDLSAAPDADGYVRGAGGDAEGDRLRNIENLVGSDYADRLTGDGNDNVLMGLGGGDTLDGGGGGDAAVYWFSDAGVTIDLSAAPDADGYVRGAGGDAEGDRLKSIEHLLGSDYADHLTGDSNSNLLDGGPGADMLDGGSGNDDLEGGAGADVLDGGPGVDRADYWFSDAGVTIDLSAAPDADGYVRGAGGDAEGDRLKNIENIRGSDYADRLTGDGNDNALEGSEGDDMLNGGPGDDELTGDGFLEDGADRFVFDAGSGHDTITDFEPGVDKIQFTEPGIAFADLRIEANGGNARVSWGEEGQSITLTGVADTALTEVSFLFNEDAPTDMPGPDPINGTPESETLNGTTGADTINGLGGDDTLHGLAGADTLNGDAGDDKLHGGAGADTLNGGPGADYAYYTDSSVGVLVRLHDARAVKFGDAEGDTLTGIEHLVGSEHNDTLAGDGADNILEGRDGDDVLYGGPAGGDDRMYGGDGDDRVFGGRGNDTLTGGEGNDELKGGPGEDTLIADGDDMDVLYGGTGKDTFQFFPSNVGGGSIRDFTDGEDVIDLTAFTGINSMADLDIVSYGDNVRIELSGTDYLTTIILSDFDVNNLDNSDFLF